MTCEEGNPTFDYYCDLALTSKDSIRGVAYILDILRPNTCLPINVLLAYKLSVPGHSVNLEISENCMLAAGVFINFTII